MSNENELDVIGMNTDNMAAPEEQHEVSASNESVENELGEVQISAGVIAMIARTAVLNVPGVVGLCSTFAERLFGFLGKSSEGSGISVAMDGRNVSIGLRIVVAYGVRIPEVVWQVQNDIRNGVENTTGKTVKTVNVVVQSVKAPSKIDSEELA